MEMNTSDQKLFSKDDEEEATVHLEESYEKANVSVPYERVGQDLAAVRLYITQLQHSPNEEELEQIDQILRSRDENLKKVFPLFDNDMTHMNVDITLLEVDAIVNPANEQGLGCFKAGHNCLDNVIHWKAGPRLRVECRKQLNGRLLCTGTSMITPGFLLPSKYVIHTVGPINYGTGKLQFEVLAACYTSCLDIALDNNCKTIAFPAISTGVFLYPTAESALVAFNAVQKWLDHHRDTDGNAPLKVIFATFDRENQEAYSQLFDSSG